AGRQPPERFEQQRAPGAEIGAGITLQRRPGEPQTRRRQFIGQARGVTRESIGVELEIETIHAARLGLSYVAQLSRTASGPAARHAALAFRAQIEQNTLGTARS